MDRNTAKYHSCSMAMLGILAIIIMSMCPIRLIMALPGGRETIPDAQNNKELQKLANFAVTQYSSQKGLRLKYLKLVSAEQQVVSGVMYYLHLKASPKRGQTCSYEAQVWVQAWRNFKSLQNFTLEQCS